MSLLISYSTVALVPKAIVLFTVIVLGGGTLPILQLLRVEGAASASQHPKPMQHSEGRDAESLDSRNQNTPSTTRHSSNQIPMSGKGWIEHIDEEYLRPTLSTTKGSRIDRTSITSFQRLANIFDEGETMTPHDLTEAIAQQNEGSSPFPT